MKKIEFYSAVLNSDGKKGKLQRKGYIIKTETNDFGIYKNDFDEFDIIDLKTGLSINFLHYYKLKDFKNDIRKFDNKLNDFKKAYTDKYKQLVETFEKYGIIEEV